MSKDELISLAREAGIFVPIAETYALGAMTIKTLEDFAALVAAREREAFNKELKRLRYDFEQLKRVHHTEVEAIRSRSTD